MGTLALAAACAEPKPAPPGDAGESPLEAEIVGTLKTVHHDPGY